MTQALIIVRGAPASGKTTICSKLRDTDHKVAWVSVDGIKPIFSDFDDRDVDISYQTALHALKFLLDQGYSVVFDGIFTRPEQQEYLQQAITAANTKDIPAIIYQLTSSLETLIKRHQARDWVKVKDPDQEAEKLTRMYQKMIDNPIENSIELNTENQSLEECLAIIRQNLV